MFFIRKITSHPVVDFAAQELKKYLRMMMPLCGEIAISYDPAAKDGFRLGLMEDFGLDTSEAEDQDLDDIVHIDTKEDGGIIAGNNPRSVLLAVYRYLTENGCRWLFPGVDGERIPVRKAAPTRYHKMADSRYRGQCNEGAESQQSLLDTIDYTPKVGMNVYMLEFDIPRAYYDYYYNHRYNEANREPEPISDETILQWKRVCEVEMAKRGLQFHDIGHGWTVEAFGIKATKGWDRDAANPVPEESRKYLAQVDGVRGLYHDVAMNTNFCMSNPEARRILIKTVCDYAERNTHVSYLHVWLADWQKNHCECDECRKMIPSDWYVVLMNELDEELTRRGLPTRIVFCAYSDTSYEALEQRIQNPDRFTILLAAISRSYTYSVPKDPKVENLAPYVLNKSARPDSMEEYIVRLNRWKKLAPCNSFAYEYHFWKHQFYAPGVLCFARRICEDVESYRDNGLNGIIEDASQRCFFPNGFSFYCYGQKLFDHSLTYEELEKDYFESAYGDAAETVLSYLKTVDRLMPQTYMECKHTSRHSSNFYKPEMETSFTELMEKVKEYRAILSEYKNMPLRVQTVAVRLMLLHTEFVEGLAKVMTVKCLGKDEEAKAASKAFFDAFGKNEIAWERYYDHKQMVQALSPIFNKKSQVEM